MKIPFWRMAEEKESKHWRTPAKTDLKVGDTVKVGRRKGVISEIYTTGEVAYNAHNGMKVAHYLAHSSKVVKITRGEFLAHCKKHGHTCFAKI